MIFIKDAGEITGDCILYFYAGFMSYKPRYNEIMKNLSDKYKVKVFAIDAEQFVPLCKKYAVKYVPSFVFINGDKVKKIEGLIMASAIKACYLDIFNDKNKGDL